MRPAARPLFAVCAISALLCIASVGRADDSYGRFQFDDDLRDHWSFRPLERPAVPTAPAGAWARNPIDAFVLSGLQEAGLKPAPPAARATLLRRVYLDLIGLPPTPAELDAFLADTSDTAFEKVVDQLLARPQYGERWARHWLDVVRYAETNGYERDGAKPQAWRYRDWVIDAFNDDMPYDRFLIEQLAGDEIAGSDARSQIATTMLRLGPWDDEPADPLVDRYDQLDDIVAATSATFLGLTLRCARCHDHKFEPLSQKDYTRWLTIFSPLKRPQKDRTDLERDLGPYEEVAAHQALVKKLDGERSQIEGQVATLEWQVYARAASDGRLPLAAGKDKPATEQIAPELAELVKDVPVEALMALGLEPAKRDDKQKKLLAKHYEKLKPLARELSSGEERGQFASWEQELRAAQDRYPAPLPKGYILYEDGPTAEAGHVFKRGDPRTPGDEVAPGFPAILVDASPAAPAPAAHTTGRRLQLAQWLARADHPLTARVMVNRLWQHHFGDGIVSTENDFGVMGAAPSNQPLLDWLASELAAGDWRLKRIHRMIVLSETYRMASTANPAAETIDPDGKLMWRFRPRRMEAESLRDTILSVSGQLNPAVRGPSVFPKISREVLETQSRPGDGWRPSTPIDAARRSVYVFVKRTLLVPELEVLDFPSTEETCEQRVVSTVAPQALTFLNGEFIHEQAQAWARRLVADAEAENVARIDLAYRLSLSRLPSDQERAAVLEFLARQQAQIEADGQGKITTEAAQAKALTALCLVLLNTNEFAYLQ